MAKTMTQSSITDGQIDKAADVFRAALRKHRAEFVSDVAQQIVLNPALGHKLLAVFRQMVEEASNMVVRSVKVNRDRTPQQALDAMDRQQYVDHDVVFTIPRQGRGEEKVEVVFFTLGRYASDEEVECELADRQLVRDEYAQMAVNEADPSFADEHPNGVSWKDAEGKWCFIACCRGGGERNVTVSRSDCDWCDYWWFGGVRKLDS